MSYLPVNRLEAGDSAFQSLSEPPEWTAERVITRLEAAGRTLLLLPSINCAPASFRSAWANFSPSGAHEAYGYQDAVAPLPTPYARDIAKMDEAYGWVRQLPADRTQIRRVVLYRTLVHPRKDPSDRSYHIWGWAKLARLLHCDYRAVQHWHDKGIAMILEQLDPVAAAAARELDRIVRSRSGRRAASG